MKNNKILTGVLIVIIISVGLYIYSQNSKQNSEITEITPSIPLPGKPVVQIITPNGDEVWEIGKTYKIEWKISNVANLQIWRYYISIPEDEGGSIVLGEQLNNTHGTETWTVPAKFTPKKYTVRMELRERQVNGDSFSDSSDGQFSIIKPKDAPEITLLYPNGNETLKSGSELTIRWESKHMSSMEKIKICIRRTDVSIFEASRDHACFETLNTGEVTIVTPEHFGPKEVKYELTLQAGDGKILYVRDVSDSSFEIL